MQIRDKGEYISHVFSGMRDVLIFVEEKYDGRDSYVKF